MVMNELSFEKFIKGNHEANINENIKLVYENINLFGEETDDLRLEITFYEKGILDEEKYSSYWRGFTIHSRKYDLAMAEIRDCVIRAYTEYGTIIGESMKGAWEYE